MAILTLLDSDHNELESHNYVGVSIFDLVDLANSVADFGTIDGMYYEHDGWKGVNPSQEEVQIRLKTNL